MHARGMNPPGRLILLCQATDYLTLCGCQIPRSGFGSYPKFITRLEATNGIVNRVSGVKPTSKTQVDLIERQRLPALLQTRRRAFRRNRRAMEHGRMAVQFVDRNGI